MSKNIWMGVLIFFTALMAVVHRWNGSLLTFIIALFLVIITLAIILADSYKRKNNKN